MSTASLNTSYYYVRPTDSLFVRGNLAFGDSGEHGASLMPPPPSLFAGAFRSALLGKDAAQMTVFLQQGRCTDAALAQCLGTPELPGDFRITWLSLAGSAGDRGDDGAALPEPVIPLPADLMMLGNHFAALEPRAHHAGVQSAGDLPLRATLVSAKQEKPKGGMFLRGKGLTHYLQGLSAGKLDTAHSIESKYLYQRDPRLGIGLNADARTAEEGQIYTTEGFAFSPQGLFMSTGFLVGIEGVAKLLPDTGLLRLGGDGRSAQYSRVAFTAPTVAKLLGAQKQFRLLLQTPALFNQGWLPDGVTELGGCYRLQGRGFSARLACAVLARREIVSGWDLHQWKPKPAQAAAPAGSVYWFDQFEGDADKLAAWVAKGLWPDDLSPGQQVRRAEGYNRALLGAWN
jgi:CRISPR-associated protein Cmr3